MHIDLSAIWSAAGFLIILQVGAFAWRVGREITVGEKGEINWLPPADILNMVSMLIAFLGVFIFPLAGLDDENIPKISLGISIVLFAGYPFALAGHYELYTKGKRKYRYTNRQEIIPIIVAEHIALAYLVISIFRISS